MWKRKLSHTTITQEVLYSLSENERFLNLIKQHPLFWKTAKEGLMKKQIASTHQESTFAEIYATESTVNLSNLSWIQNTEVVIFISRIRWKAVPNRFCKYEASALFNKCGEPPHKATICASENAEFFVRIAFCRKKMIFMLLVLGGVFFLKTRETKSKKRKIRHHDSHPASEHA